MDAKQAEAQLIAYAATFPGAWEDHPWDHTVIKVGKKVFVFFGGAASPPGELSLTVKLPVSYEMALTLPYMSPAGHGLWNGGHDLYNSPSFGHARNATTPLSALLTGRSNVVNQRSPRAWPAA